jgi:hypothetical protein
MALCFGDQLFHIFFSDFQPFRPEHHWRDLICRNAYLVHQNWYRIRFAFQKTHDWLLPLHMSFCRRSISNLFLHHRLAAAKRHMRFKPTTLQSRRRPPNPWAAATGVCQAKHGPTENGASEFILFVISCFKLSMCNRFGGLFFFFFLLLLFVACRCFCSFSAILSWFLFWV